ncbi:MAG TPA: extensin family protein [Hyphomicrobiaceae bacterium]
MLTPSPPGMPGAPSAQSPSAWSAQEIADGRAHCAALLQGLDLVAVPAEPIREDRDGETCGTPAPMQLVSIGSSPKITFSPPAMLTCDMIAALHKWLVSDVQPLARKHLGSPVTSVKTMSSFSCRTAYNRARTRLSEHGRVNALDLGAFTTAQGETRVVADWGPVAREFATKIGPTQAETIKRQAEAAAAARKARLQQKTTDGPRLAAPATVKSSKSFQADATIPIGIPRITLGARPSGGATDLSTGLGWASPSRLGGPKEDTAPLPDASPAAKAAFLHEVHSAACAIFATVLGPDANRDHRNHFHLDMAGRTSASICE